MTTTCENGTSITGRRIEILISASLDECVSRLNALDGWQVVTTTDNVNPLGIAFEMIKDSGDSHNNRIIGELRCQPDGNVLMQAEILPKIGEQARKLVYFMGGGFFLIVLTGMNLWLVGLFNLLVLFILFLIYRNDLRNSQRSLCELLQAITVQ
ncbi:MAG: hypothetical protein KJ064_08035 [Anaerolineae bacterium]|nr:hypothetical protein [Anaerolineae bacterium]